jgi:hypothetical protein
MNDIKSLILHDFNIYYNSIITFILILIVIAINLQLFDLLYIFIILIYINKIKKNKIKSIINSIYCNETHEIVKISNLSMKPHLFYTNKYILPIYPILCLFNKHFLENTKIFVRLIAYNNNNIILRYPINFIQSIPDKCIMIINHGWLKRQYITNIFISLLLFPKHKYVICTGSMNITNKLKKKLGELSGKIIWGQYFLNKNKISIFQDIYNMIQNNNKIIILIFPEGNNSMSIDSNYNLMQHNIENFNIYDMNCNNYRCGPFIMSLMSNIPIIQTIFYMPMPNYNYVHNNNIKYMNYYIKHINHIGVKLYHMTSYDINIPFNDKLTDITKYIDENSFHIEKYRKIMEDYFHERYIETLIESHKFN